ncbi:MAG TPA: hypothetical protein IAC31_06300 [Candidatus Faecousia intestinigallinarum]|nr:hypothetical protein [Candidatus Faecousia intestinigallinarum]
MLYTPTKEALEAHLEWLYTLTQNPAHSGYPLYCDGILGKADFFQRLRQGLQDSSRELLFFEINGQLQGCIQFFYLDADRYLQTECFCIAHGTEAALTEFLKHVRARYQGYTLYLGFPKRNTAAIAFLSENGWVCLEEAYHDVFFLENYIPTPQDPRIISVTRENFPEFQALHTLYEEDMYWNSQRLYRDLERWDIRLYQESGNILGALLCREEEIFAVEYQGGIFREEIYKALLSAVLNDLKSCGKNHLLFLQDGESQAAALSLGFACAGEYALYTKTI